MNKKGETQHAQPLSVVKGQTAEKQNLLEHRSLSQKTQFKIQSKIQKLFR